jgi:uncharacterized DUF497 family protein
LGIGDRRAWGTGRFRAGSFQGKLLPESDTIRPSPSVRLEANALSAYYGPMTDRMKISFDPRKDATNQRDHHLPLAFGERVLAGRVLEFRDTRFDYGEERLVCFGYVEGRLHVCVYTVREDSFRMISVRKANDREIRRYG